MGIEPTPSAWKAGVLPLNYARAPHNALAILPPIIDQKSRKDWRGQDSNLRRHSRQIYSLIPLAAREPLQAKRARHCLQDPAACQPRKRP